MSVLKLENVSIRYKVGDFRNIGLKETVVRKLRGSYRVTEFWADRDVSFSLEQGDMLGIVGVNGAGKSTLLKAIAGIMTPSSGTIERRGTVAAARLGTKNGSSYRRHAEGGGDGGRTRGGRRLRRLASAGG